MNTKSNHSRRAVVVADDHPLMLQGLTEFLACDPAVEIVGSYADGRAVWEGILSLRPQAAIVDIRLPVIDGLTVLELARSSKCETAIILLTAELTDSQIHRAWSNDVDGLLLKSAATSELLECLHAVFRGQRWLPEYLADAVARFEEKLGRGARLFGDLTEREREVAALAAMGLQNKEIARQLAIAAGTVKIHLNNVYQKLGVPNRTALATKVLPFVDVLGPSAAVVHSGDAG